MEETWELAALGIQIEMSNPEKNREWSAKHTRLRYQAVVSSLGLLLISTQKIEKFKVPGFFDFNDTPNYTVLWIALLAFALFSLFSFFIQSKLEKSVSNLSGDRVLEELKLLLETKTQKTLESVPSFEPLVVGKAIWENLAVRKQAVADVDMKKFNANSALILDNFNTVSKFNSDAVDVLAFWRSDFDAILPDLTSFSGDYVMELRRMDGIVERADTAYQRFAKAWQYFELMAPPSADIRKSLAGDVNGQEFGYSISEVDKYLGLMKSSIELFNKFGTDVLVGATRHNNVQNVSSNILSSRIPFWFSVSLISFSVVFSIRNIYVFWT